MWNLSTPFSEAAHNSGGSKVTRPKALQKAGSGGYNYGMKQSIKNCAAGGVGLTFVFYGYDKSNPKAKCTYVWKPATKSPYTIKLKETINKPAVGDCNVPILVQSIKSLKTLKTAADKREFVKGRSSTFSAALSRFQRMYKLDTGAAPHMRGMHGTAIIHRDCFTPILDHFNDTPLALPPGPLVLVGERFYTISLIPGVPLPAEWREGMDNLVVQVPGKGMAPPYKAFGSDRVLHAHTFTSLVASVISKVIRAADTATPAALEIRKALATQLMPLLLGGESTIFGATRNKFVTDLLWDTGTFCGARTSCETCSCASGSATRLRRRGSRRRPSSR